MISIRRFQRPDLEAVARVHDPARLIELELAGLSAAFLPFDVAAEREGFFDYDIAVAERGGAILGFVAYEPGELAWLYVDPRRHREGVGRALAEYALERCGPSVLVEVLVGNAPALSLYRSLGFDMLETAKGVMPGNEEFRVEAARLRREAGRQGVSQ